MSGAPWERPWERPWHVGLLTPFRPSPRHCPVCGRMGEAIVATKKTAWSCPECMVGWRSEKQEKKWKADGRPLKKNQRNERK